MDLKESYDLCINETQRHPWERARYEVIVFYLKKYIKNINKQTLNILDIGCGDIYFIKKLSDDFPFFEFWAVDTAFTDENIRELNKIYKLKKIHF